MARINEPFSTTSVVNIVAVFTKRDCNESSAKMSIPITTTPEQLNQIVKNLLPEESHVYTFYINDKEVTTPLEDFIAMNKIKVEVVLNIIYDELDEIRVSPVTHCSSCLPGHKASILVVKFSPNGAGLATGSGDSTVRIWDLTTELPLHVLEEHKGWVQSLAWSPDATKIASGCTTGMICLWDASSGNLLRNMSTKTHSYAVLDISWEPFLTNQRADTFVTAHKDGSLKIWSITSSSPLKSFSGHSAAVTCVCWGGKNLIYSASRDKSIKTWCAKTGKVVRTLKGHAHWVNHLSLSTSYALRIGYHDPLKTIKEKLSRLEVSKRRYNTSIGVYGGNEYLVSGSDDHTAYLWNPVETEKPVARLLGHQQPVSFVRFSPDGKYIVTASFDKSVRIWRAQDGKFIKTLRGHVGAVYQICWAADSRHFVTGSRDSTLKVWNVKTAKRKTELPGHSDEVYAVDWSPDGSRVASGSKDSNLRIWRK